MKRRRTPVQINERQQLILALVLVLLIAISLLYCVGLGSLAVREVWRNTPVLSTETLSPEQNGLAPSSFPAPSPLPTPAAR